VYQATFVCWPALQYAATIGRDRVRIGLTFEIAYLPSISAFAIVNSRFGAPKGPSRTSVGS
jgi:hypothetical protein